MTIVASRLWRRFPRLRAAPCEERLFEVEPGVRILGRCHWQGDAGARRSHPTLVLIHGLEGSSESLYMLGTADKAWAAGFNVVRLNQRNCGGTDHLSPTLYNSGLSGDYRAVVLELIERDGLGEIYVAGFSMGGNLTMKMAGEFGSAAPRELRGVVGVCPSIDLAACADACDSPRNWIYRRYFVRQLKKRFRRKMKLFPGRFEPRGSVEAIQTIRQFDDVVTAPICGYGDANNYYHRASALRVVDRIAVPALILTAQDDPLVPYAMFEHPAVTGNPRIRLVAPRYGAHCGFVSRHAGEERFWAEVRLVEFCLACHQNPAR
jgi:predicted alpha/beta-fold hydrolase